MIPATTRNAQTKQKRDKWRNQDQKSMAKQERHRNTGEKYCATRTIPGGGTRREIAYIKADAKRREEVYKSGANPEWGANMNQGQKHRIQTGGRKSGFARQSRTRIAYSGKPISEIARNKYIGGNLITMGIAKTQTNKKLTRRKQNNTTNTRI